MNQQNSKGKVALLVISVILLCGAIGTGAFFVVRAQNKNLENYRNKKTTETTVQNSTAETTQESPIEPQTETTETEQMTGGGGVELTPEEQAALQEYLNSLNLVEPEAEEANEGG